MQSEEGKIREWPLPARRVTPAEGHYFFGYFDKYQIDPKGRYLLTQKASFMDRQPTPEDDLEIGLIDLADNNRYHPLTKTSSWCWQQGCMLQWLPGGKPTEYIYNDRREGRFTAVKADIEKGEIGILPLPVYCLAPDGSWAASVNFSRLAVERPGYGYEGVPDPWGNQTHPREDGIRTMDMNTGQNKLIVSLDQLAHFPPERSSFSFGPHWVNHLAISGDSRRLMFLHRWRLPGEKRLTRFFTVGREGNELYLLNDCDMTSHMAWIDHQRIIAFANRDHWGYYEFTDQSDQVREVGAGMFSDDGHCSCSQDGQWMLTDTYWDKTTEKRTLILFRMADEVRFNLGRYYGQMSLPQPVRCDLHPRWSRDEQMITFDSLHEGFRGVYAVDIKDFRRQFDFE